ncbi:MAG: hypothetical protein PHG06_00325 [Parabacteroides sp.]|nr:hypothetical protein [Parabacteroides sp.]
MAVDIGFSKSAVGVGAEDLFEPMILKVGANATAAKMLPGIAVIRDTNDYSVKEYGSTGSAVVGVLGWEATPNDFRPASRDTAYAIGKECAVHYGPGKIRMRLAASQTIVKGDMLTPTTDGYLIKATINGVVSVVESGSATDSTGNSDVYAEALETVSTGAGETAGIFVFRLR